MKFEFQTIESKILSSETPAGNFIKSSGKFLKDSVGEKQSIMPLTWFIFQDRYAAKYAFGYRVHDAHSGSDYGHEEHRDGDTTKGHYHVLLPDGRLQNVNYEAGPHGYNAVVTYH